MFRTRNPPMPHPARPDDASTSANYLSAQIQQLLAMILPQPVVAVLAAISDALYRLTLGKSNSPASYTSTLVPPAILILVTYLSILLVYKSIRSFVGLLIFSLKWLVILGVVGVLLAYHFGNGDVQQGAQQLAQQSGIGQASTGSWGDMIRMSQQYAPYLSYVPSTLGFGSGANTNAQQGAASWLAQQFQGQQAGEAYGRQRDDPLVREYRDLRPSRYVQETYGNVPRDDGRRGMSASSSQQSFERQRSRDSRSSKKQSGRDDEPADYASRFSRWIGADMGGGSAAKTEKKKRP